MTEKSKIYANVREIKAVVISALPNKVVRCRTVGDSTGGPKKDVIGGEERGGGGGWENAV